MSYNQNYRGKPRGGYRPPSNQGYEDPSKSGNNSQDQQPNHQDQQHQGQGQRGRGKGPSNKSRDNKRRDAHREINNKKEMDAIADDINKTIFLGFGSLQEAVDKMSLKTRNASPLPISTHPVGPLVQRSIVSLLNLVNPNTLPGNFSVFPFYRISLCQASLKMFNAYASRSANTFLPPGNQQRDFLTSDMRDAIKGCRLTLLPIANYVNAIGNVTVGDENYSAYFPTYMSPSTITLDTLSQATQLCANVATPRRTRNAFYRYNPFPFAVWEQDDEEGWRLANSDQIMPVGYNLATLRQDLDVVEAFFSKIQTKYPTRVGKIVSYDGLGHKCTLISSSGNLRAANVSFQDIQQSRYGVSLNGDVTELWSAERAVTDVDYYYASMILAGNFEQENPLYNNIPERHSQMRFSTGTTSSEANIRVHYGA